VGLLPHHTTMPSQNSQPSLITFPIVGYDQLNLAAQRQWHLFYQLALHVGLSSDDEGSSVWQQMRHLFNNPPEKAQIGTISLPHESRR